MAEMTVEQARERLIITGSHVLYQIAALIQSQQQTIDELNREVERQTIQKDGYKKQLSDALWKINEQQQIVEAQAREIRMMKCCGNCRYYEPYRRWCDTKTTPVQTTNPTGKCDKWQGVSNND